MTADNEQRFARPWELYGYEVLDSHGDKLGLVERVWGDGTSGGQHVEDEANGLKFIGLRTGSILRRLPGTARFLKTHVIPAHDATVDSGTRSIRVSYPAERIRGAPSYATAWSLTSEQERTVSTYYDTA